MIEVNGRRFRTLANPITVNGQKVKEVWASHDGMPSTKVYPEGLYVAKSAGSRNIEISHTSYDEDNKWQNYYSVEQVKTIKHNYCFSIASRGVQRATNTGVYLEKPIYIDLNVYSKFENPIDIQRSAESGIIYDDRSRLIIGLLNSGCLFHAHFDFGALTDEETAQLSNFPDDTKEGYELTHRHLLEPTSFEDYYYTYKIYKPNIGILGLRTSVGDRFNRYGFIYDFCLRFRRKLNNYDKEHHFVMTYFSTDSRTCFYVPEYIEGVRYGYRYQNFSYEWDPIYRRWDGRIIEDPPEEAFYADMPSTTFSQ